MPARSEAAAANISGAAITKDIVVLPSIQDAADARSSSMLETMRAYRDRARCSRAHFFTKCKSLRVFAFGSAGFDYAGSARDLLFIVGLDEHRAGRALQSGRVGTDVDDAGAALNLFPRRD
jgi:hypothetical protein